MAHAHCRANLEIKLNAIEIVRDFKYFHAIKTQVIDILRSHLKYKSRLYCLCVVCYNSKITYNFPFFISNIF